MHTDATIQFVTGPKNVPQFGVPVTGTNARKPGSPGAFPGLPTMLNPVLTCAPRIEYPMPWAHSCANQTAAVASVRARVHVASPDTSSEAGSIPAATEQPYAEPPTAGSRSARSRLIPCGLDRIWDNDREVVP